MECINLQNKIKIIKIFSFYNGSNILLSAPTTSLVMQGQITIFQKKTFYSSDFQSLNLFSLGFIIYIFFSTAQWLGLATTFDIFQSRPCFFMPHVSQIRCNFKIITSYMHLCLYMISYITYSYLLSDYINQNFKLIPNLVIFGPLVWSLQLDHANNITSISGLLQR